MDQLDILKKNWQSQTSETPQFTSDQLTGLLAKKSTGIVKWLFIIAIIEFSLFAIVGLFSHFSDQQQESIELLGQPLYYGSLILHYVVIIFFIYLFYSNYKNISTEQPTRSLMKSILKTRRTMKWYIWYNLIYIMVLGMIMSAILIPNDPRVVHLMESPNAVGHETAFYFMFFGICFVIFLVLCVVMYLIYMLIYGILLRRLKRNYNELKRMEV
ncbi:MAG: hypothetical protein ABF274_10770 [Nonlabens sp.]|uniref:hypothetical protein n=1 Tax=Nonlabens sp. TaxID=1888209 RepID=UPI0032199865